jgi:hypothetical protein
VHLHCSSHIFLQTQQKMWNRPGFTYVMIMQANLVHRLVKLLFVIFHWTNLHEIKEFIGFNPMSINFKFLRNNHHKMFPRMNPCWMFISLKPIWSLSVFFALARYRVLKITHFCSEVVLWTIKHTMVYPGAAPSLEVIDLCQAAWYWRWTMVTMGWAESSRSSQSEGGNDLVVSSPLPEG